MVVSNTAICRIIIQLTFKKVIAYTCFPIVFLNHVNEYCDGYFCQCVNIATDVLDVLKF